jgi:hypothetical protein
MNTAQKTAVELVRIAYNDCADICIVHANNAEIGLAKLSPEARFAVKHVLIGLAESMRKKSVNFESTVFLALKSEGQA